MKKVLKIVALFGAVYLVLRAVDLQEVARTLAAIDVLWVVVLVALSFLMVAVSVLKWRLFLRQGGTDASFCYLFGLYLMGYFVNLLLPSAIGGDIVRSLYVGTRRDRVRALSATILERGTGVLAMVGLACLALVLADTVPVKVARLVVGTAFVVFAAVLLLLSDLPRRVATRVTLPERLRRALLAVCDAVQVAAKSGSDLVVAMILSLVFHLLTIVNTIVAAYAVGWNHASFVDLCAVIPLILLIGAIPLTPQGLGVQEGAFMYFLHSVGASAPQALAIALVLRSKTYLLALFGGLALLFLRRRGSSGGPRTTNGEERKVDDGDHRGDAVGST